MWFEGLKFIIIMVFDWYIMYSVFNFLLSFIKWVIYVFVIYICVILCLKFVIFCVDFRFYYEIIIILVFFMLDIGLFCFRG